MNMRGLFILVMLTAVSLASYGQAIDELVTKADSLSKKGQYTNAVFEYFKAMSIFSDTTPQAETVLKIVESAYNIINTKFDNSDRKKTHDQFMAALSQAAQAQKISIKDTALDTEAILEFPTQNKSQLFSQISKFVADAYNSAKDVVQLSDAENGNIVVRSIYDLPPGFTIFHIRYTMSIAVKAEKIKVKIYQQRLTPYNINEDIGSIEEILTTRRNKYMLKGDFEKVERAAMVHNFCSIMRMKVHLLGSAKDSNW